METVIVTQPTLAAGESLARSSAAVEQIPAEGEEEEEKQNGNGIGGSAGCGLDAGRSNRHASNLR